MDERQGHGGGDIPGWGMKEAFSSRGLFAMANHADSTTCDPIAKA